jgi:hypothetical protein
MAKVRPAAGATYLFAVHSAGVVFKIFHMVGRDWLEIARPAGAGIKFVLVAEKRQVASGAVIDSILIFSPRTSERSFRSMLAHNFELLRRDNFSPFIIGFLNFFDCHTYFYGKRLKLISAAFGSYPEAFSDSCSYDDTDYCAGGEVGKPVDGHGNADADIEGVKDCQISDKLIFRKKIY